MKITLYTIKDCAFSKQEKEYLNTNKLVFEEKDLETNKDFLTEMLAISNNFAGTPVTRVEKDDGSIAVLKGFTKEEFDITFGFAVAPINTQAPAANGQTPVTAPSTVSGQVNDTPIAAETLPKVEDIKPVTEVVPPVETIPPAPAPTPVETPETPPVVNTPDPLRSVMDDLQSKSQPTDEPTVTEPLPPNAPSIPDFPAK